MFDKKLTQYKIEKLWHFTDRSNLPLIKRHGGILSLRKLRELEIEVPYPGGNDWSHDADTARGLDKYINLTLIPNHPMLYTAKQQGRILDPVWLSIRADIALHKDVRFCKTVSNRSDSEILDHARAAEELDLEALFTYMDWSDPEVHARRRNAEKSEVLIPDLVPVDKILGFQNG